VPPSRWEAEEAGGGLEPERPGALSLGLLGASASPPAPEAPAGLAVEGMGRGGVEPGALLPAGLEKLSPGSRVESPSGFGYK